MNDREYVYIKHKVLKLTGVDLGCYKTPQVQRRLKTYLLRSGHATWYNFFSAVQSDATALGHFRDYLTINVSAFFRDPDKFDYLRQNIIPGLLRGHPRLRVWSAGCSQGHEPYSLAILLAEMSGIYSQHYILATDIDQSALEHARAGGPYIASELENVSPVLLKRYFQERNGAHHVIDGMRRKVTFRPHNLLADSFEEQFDLIVCRNVVIYFTAEVKARLYRLFRDALRPGGVLFVGGTEVISRANDLGLESAGISFYRKAISTPPLFLGIIKA